MSAHLADLFFAAANAHPEREALVFSDATLSYRELDTCVRRLRSQLDATRDGPFCGVFAHRSTTAFAGVLAVLAAGNAYVPLSPAFPALRNRAIADKARLHTLIVGAECAGALRELLIASSGAYRVVTLAHEPVIEALAREFPGRVEYTWSDHTPPLAAACEVSGDALAYVLFTSGSTGEPKGVMVRQRNVLRYVQNLRQLYPIHGDDRLSQMFDLTFDLSVHDMFVAWAAGATLVVYPSAGQNDPLDYTRRQRVSVWFSVPSVAVMLDNLRRAEPGALPGLRLSLFCGEPLTWNTWRVWRQVAPQSRVVNLYGPTETTIAITHFEVPEHYPEHASASGIIPIGRAFPGQRVSIRGDDATSCSAGAAGALWLSGDQLSAGYLGAPELSAERFVADGGETSYRTGDRALCDADGCAHFLGREDNQVKIMGYRVELAEVEHALMQVSGAAHVMADIVVRDGLEELFAVLPAALSDQKSAIREALAQRLPAYMLPRRYIFATEFPRNTSGKLDRKALREQVQNRQRVISSLEAAR